MTNMRPTLNFPTPKPTWMPRRARPISTLLDLLIAIGAVAVMGAVLFLL
ncbi:MAG: hypothetical protein HY040_21330 [Planctomycetes bacterium]|nr:hypothetical protein [Planctomycetota bacterium]